MDSCLIDRINELLGPECRPSTPSEPEPCEVRDDYPKAREHRNEITGPIFIGSRTPLYCNNVRSEGCHHGGYISIDPSRIAETYTDEDVRTFQLGYVILHERLHSRYSKAQESILQGVLNTIVGEIFPATDSMITHCTAQDIDWTI